MGDATKDSRQSMRSCPDEDSFEIRVDEMASATVYKTKAEQYPGILQQFVGELLSRSYQENKEAFG